MIANLGFHLDTSGKERPQLKNCFYQIGLWAFLCGFLAANVCRRAKPSADRIIPRQAGLGYVKKDS